jgi:hypothetical protein
MASGELAAAAITVNPDDLDKDGFVSLWNIASTSSGQDVSQARSLASQLLSFLCITRCPFVTVSPTDVEYLDDWFEREEKLMCDWSPENDKVDVITQHACVPADALLRYLQSNEFDPSASYNPRRSTKIAWYNDDWNVG